MLRISWFKSVFCQSYVVYQATVTNSETKKVDNYIGLTENTFKSRYTQHKSSFKLAHKRSSTRLSEHIWTLKDKNIEFTIDWKILKQCQRFSPGKRFCQVCLEEKHLISKLKPSLNSRNQFFYKCLHARKYTLIEYETRQASSTSAISLEKWTQPWVHETRVENKEKKVCETIIIYIHKLYTFKISYLITLEFHGNSTRRALYFI